MLSWQCPRPMTRKAPRYDHHVLTTPAAMTTPTVWSRAETTVTALWASGIFRYRARRSGRATPLAPRRSVGRTAGSRSEDGSMVVAMGVYYGNQSSDTRA